MRILLAANSDWYLFHFRRRLIEVLIARGDDVAVACPDGPHRGGLERLGATWWPVTIDRRGMNPFRDLDSVRQHRRVLDAVQPVVVHAFTLKSIVAIGFAVRHRRFARTAVLNSFEGLGHMFNSHTMHVRLLRPAVRAVLTRLNVRRRTMTVVLNRADRDLFLAHGMARQAMLRLVPGTGVDLAEFPLRTAQPVTFRILYASRLLHAKGPAVLVAATEIVAERHDVELAIAGTTDVGNPDSVGRDELERWAHLPFVTLLGQRDDIPQLIAEAAVVVLVSRYAEGLPTILVEANAVGAPVITSDQGGCREIVADGVNGLVVPADDPAALARALERLGGDVELARRLGLEGRRIVESRFSDVAINHTTVALYDELVATP